MTHVVEIMGFNEYQNEAARTADFDKIKPPVDLLQWVHTLDRESAKKELGEALCCLAIAAFHLGLPLEEVAKNNVLALRARFPNQVERRPEP